jgi:hypothetical protein
MSQPFKLLETFCSEELEEVQQEVLANNKVWWVVDKWCIDNGYEYFVKEPKIACVPLIAGKEPPYVKTPFYEFFPKLTIAVAKRFGCNISRINIQKVKPESCYDIHTDNGAYFLTADRYALAVNQGYVFKVDGKEVKIGVGDLFWFDNQKPHGAFNASKNERIAVIIDVQKES